MHHEILNFDLAKSIDGVGYPPQERRYITLVLAGRVGLAEVLHGPRCSLAHPSSLLPAPLGTVALVDRGERETDEVTPSGSVSVFAGFRFPPEVISVAVRWYLRYGLSYRDVEELLAERAVTVDHVTIYRWCQRFTPEFIEAARLCRHAPGDRWFIDETYVKVAGKWAYLYRAIDQHGQVIDVLLSRRRDLEAARRFPYPCAAHGHGPGRGHHRPCPCLPAGPRRAGPFGAAHRKAVREQPDRDRSRAAESPAPADAGPETASVRADPRRRARVRAEPSPRPLRHRHRRPRPPPAPHRLRRPGHHHLTGRASGIMLRSCPEMT